eukprot:scaffold107568_cov77-Phaeocystis_antarctica.AAC.9
MLQAVGVGHLIRVSVRVRVKVRVRARVRLRLRLGLGSVTLTLTLTLTSVGHRPCLVQLSRGARVLERLLKGARAAQGARELHSRLCDLRRLLLRHVQRLAERLDRHFRLVGGGCRVGQLAQSAAVTRVRDAEAFAHGSQQLLVQRDCPGVRTRRHERVCQAVGRDADARVGRLELAGHEIRGILKRGDGLRLLGRVRVDYAQLAVHVGLRLHRSLLHLQLAKHSLQPILGLSELADLEQITRFLDDGLRCSRARPHREVGRWGRPVTSHERSEHEGGQDREPARHRKLATSPSHQTRCPDAPTCVHRLRPNLTFLLMFEIAPCWEV